MVRVFFAAFLLIYERVASSQKYKQVDVGPQVITITVTDTDPAEPSTDAVFTMSVSPVNGTRAPIAMIGSPTAMAQVGQTTLDCAE